MKAPLTDLENEVMRVVYLIDMARAIRREGRRVNVAGMAMPGRGLSERMRHIFEERSMTPMPRTRVIGTLVFCMTSSVIFAGGTPTPRASAIVDADFSGSWSLVSSTYAGRGRGGTGTIGVEREVKVSIASGAPVNCGTECTIAQNAGALTITRPDQPGTTPPDIGVVVLSLDGRESTITQSNGAKYTAQAAWDDDQLVVTRNLGQSTVTQVLSVEDGQLRVVTTFSLSDAPVTLRYVRR